MKRYFQILVLSALFILIGNVGYGQKAGGNQGNTVGCNIFVPNAFTPNGDEINDRFTLKHSDVCNIQEFDLKIFDRWGRMVFETKTSDPNRAWDGTFEGKELQQGVYIWNLYVRIHPSTPTEEPVISKQGTVVIIR